MDKKPHYVQFKLSILEKLAYFLSFQLTVKAEDQSSQQTIKPTISVIMMPRFKETQVATLRNPAN